MSAMAMTYEHGRPVFILPISDDPCEMMALRLMGFDKRTGEAILLPLYRRVFEAEGDPVLAFEGCLN